MCSNMNLLQKRCKQSLFLFFSCTVQCMCNLNLTWFIQPAHIRVVAELPCCNHDNEVVPVERVNQLHSKQGPKRITNMTQIGASRK